MYAVDSVLVNAGRLRNSVTVKGPSVVEDAAASVSVELEEGVREVVAVDAGEAEEEEDVEEAAVTGARGRSANCRKSWELPSVTEKLGGLHSPSLLTCRRSNGSAIASFANPRALL